MVRSKTMNEKTVWWTRALMVLVAILASQAGAEPSRGTGRARFRSAEEQFRVEAARRWYSEGGAERLNAQLGTNAAAREFLSGGGNREVRPEIADAVMAAYARAVSSSPEAARSAAASLESVRTHLSESGPDAIAPDVVRSMVQAHRTALETGNSLPSGAMDAILNFSDGVAQRPSSLDPRLERAADIRPTSAEARLKGPNAFQEAVHVIGDVFNRLTSLAGAEPAATRPALLQHLTSLLNRAARHPESLADLSQMLTQGHFDSLTPENRRVLQGFEASLALREAASGGTRGGDPYTEAARKIAGPNGTPASVAASAAALRQADEALKASPRELETAMNTFKVEGELRRQIETALRTKSMPEVMELLEELILRNPSLDAAQRKALADFRDFLAGERYTRMVAHRLRGTAKDKIAAMRCLTRAAGLNGPAIQGVVAALVAILGAEASQSDVAAELASFRPVTSLLASASAPVAAAPPVNPPPAVSSRPTHSSRSAQPVGGNR